MKNGFSSPLLRFVALFQGIYYLVTGLWPFISMTTFQMITGPKTDLWLVKTVGAMIICSAVVILFSAYRRRFPVETVVLAISNATALLTIEVYYASAGRISAIYLLDAILEAILIILWLVGVYRARR